MKLEIVEHQIGVRPPDGADEYVKRELHPVTRATRDKANEVALLSWAKTKIATTDATATLVASYTFEDTETARVRFRAVGFSAARDAVFQEADIRYSYNGTALRKELVRVLTGPIYSHGASLSTAEVCLVDNGNILELQVTGEADTTITWRIYTHVQEAHW